MEISLWLIFFAASLAAILSPGPAILLAISNSVRFGMSKVFLSSIGNATGLFILSLAAIFGLGAILKTSNHLFFIVKFIGAAYLIYLGIRQFRSKANFFADNKLSNIDIANNDVLKDSKLSDKQTDKQKHGNDKSNIHIYSEGCLVALTNPKAILFFTALFPQFLNTETDVSLQFLIMTFTFMAMSFISLVSYGLLAYKAKNWFSVGSRTKWFNRTLGSTFMLIGVGMLSLKIEH